MALTIRCLTKASSLDISEGQTQDQDDEKWGSFPTWHGVAWARAAGGTSAALSAICPAAGL